MIWAQGQATCIAVGNKVKRINYGGYHLSDFFYHTSKQMATYGYRPIGPKELMKWKS